MISNMKVRSLAAVLFVLSASAIGAAQADIHKVDFKNFTYSAMCVGDKPQRITVRNGEFSKETPMEGFVDHFYFSVMDVAYGDINMDGKDDAVVLTVCNTGGTGNFSEGFVYTIRDGKPVIAVRIPGGDRAYGGLRSATIADGVLTVDSNDVGEQGGACCPEYAVTRQYKLAAGKLVPFGSAKRRELYPKQRLTFARGASSTTFTVRIDQSDMKRYTVGARAGQSMSVSVNTDKASVRLIDDALVTEGENSFTAKLPKNGDYTFEVQNIAETAIDVVVTVKIR